MRVRLSSSLRADKALRLVICHTQFKVRVGVITDRLPEHFFFSFLLIYVQLKSVVVFFSLKYEFKLIKCCLYTSQHAQGEKCGRETS